MILYQVEVEIEPRLDFYGGHLKKSRKPYRTPTFFSSNVADIIPRITLNKMVTLMERSGGGVHGDHFWLMEY